MADRGSQTLAPGTGNDAPSFRSGRPADGYTALQRILHWTVAGLVVLQLAVGLWIGTLAGDPANAPTLHTLLPLHLIVGTVIFALMLWRLQQRRSVGAPPSPSGTPTDARLLAKISHRGFYVLLLVMPLIGWLAFLSHGAAAGLFRGVHAGLAVTLAAAICAHLAGVAYHTLIRRDGLLQRMVASGAKRT